MLPAAWRRKQAQQQQLSSSSTPSGSGSGAASGAASGTASNSGTGSGSGTDGRPGRSSSLGELLAAAGAAPVLARPGSSVFRGEGWFY
jgi:hypothetical protein